MGSARWDLLYTNYFSGAWETAKQGVADLSGYNAVKNAISAGVDLVNGVKQDYSLNLAQQKAEGATAVSPAASSKIVAPNIPGTAVPVQPTKTTSKVPKTADVVASGGTRNTSVNINLRNMVENIVFSGGLKENRGDLEKQITQIMGRILGMAQSTA